MSGPKSSRYTLTPEQRRILAEQRKIERRKAVATEKIRKAQKQLLQIGGMFNAEKQIASELFNRTGDDNGMTTLISELETLITPIQPLVSRTNYDDVNSVEETATAVCAYLKEAEKIAAKISSIDYRHIRKGDYYYEETSINSNSSISYSSNDDDRNGNGSRLQSRYYPVCR